MTTTKKIYVRMTGGYVPLEVTASTRISGRGIFYEAESVKYARTGDEMDGETYEEYAREIGAAFLEAVGEF